MQKKLMIIVFLALTTPVLAQISEAPDKIKNSTSSTSTLVLQSNLEEETSVNLIKELTLEESIDKFSSEYNIPRIWLVNLAKCESTFGKRLIGDGGLAFGTYQYHKPTWLMFKRLSKMDLDRNSYYDQTRMTAWALANGYEYHWSCDYKTGKVK